MFTCIIFLQVIYIWIGSLGYHITPDIIQTQCFLSVTFLHAIYNPSPFMDNFEYYGTCSSVVESYCMFYQRQVSRRVSDPSLGEKWFPVIVLVQNTLIHKNIARHNIQGLYSLSGRTSYRVILWSLETARFVFTIPVVLKIDRHFGSSAVRW